MNISEISFEGNRTAKAAYISENSDIEKAIQELHIPRPRKVIVLVGGAGGIGWLDKFPMRKAIGIIAELAEATNAVVIDGGTQAGIMTEIGKQRTSREFTFPLVGVVFEGILLEKAPQDILDPNHTHFILIPGENWGDESGWIAKIATGVAGNEKSITVLINGGEISKTDVEYSLMEDRPTYVMRGTGRLADEITLTGKVFAVDVSEEPGKILESLRARLA